MNRYVDEIRAKGFTVAVKGRHASVRVGERQVAVFRVSDEGVFEWGWVERVNGRTDLRDWAQFWRALVQIARKASR